MKKFLFSALAAIPFVMNAQNVVNFEDLTLSAESYYNGSDEAGSFTSGGVSFSNTYVNDPSYPYWAGGFAYSNTTDNTTAGFANMYSAYPASGAGSSANYAVFTPGYSAAEFVDFNGTVLVSKLKVANTTYAYLSMKDGDSFAKKFGSATNADGQADGTDGKDFFFVTVYAHDANDVKTDSLDVYLADFRFEDDNDDYILASWKEVDVNLVAAKLSFKLTSSDVGEYGMNTPAYFALDDIEYATNVGVKGLEKIQVSVYPNPAENQLFVNNYSGAAKIYSMTGVLVKAVQLDGTTAVDITELTTGIYQLVTETGSVKFNKL